MSTSEMHRPVSWSDRPDGRSDAPASGAFPERAGRTDHADPDTTGDRRADPTHLPEAWLRLAAATASVPRARQHVRRALRRLLPTEEIDVAVIEALSADLELAASELVTNAVEHGGGDPLELSVSSDGAAVALEVISHGGADQVGPSSEWQVADIGSVTGRGLGIVRAVSDRVTVRRAHGTLSIRIERDLPA